MEIYCIVKLVPGRNRHSNVWNTNYKRVPHNLISPQCSIDSKQGWRRKVVSQLLKTLCSQCNHTATWDNCWYGCKRLRYIHTDTCAHTRCPQKIKNTAKHHELIDDIGPTSFESKSHQIIMEHIQNIQIQ